MPALHRLFLLPVLALGLSSCDSLKSKAVALLDEKIEETGGSGDAATADAGSAAGGKSVDSLPLSKEARIRDVTSSSFDAFSKIQGHVVVVDFYADWCGPCRRLSPLLKQIVADNNGKVLLGKVDVDQHKDIAGREGVSGIPDVRIFVNGKQVDRFVGLPSGDVARKKIESQLSKISGKAPKPAPVKPKPSEPKKPGPKTPDSKTPETDNPKEPEEEPTIKPMEKDWLPPGIQRKGT